MVDFTYTYYWHQACCGLPGAQLIMPSTPHREEAMARHRMPLLMAIDTNKNRVSIWYLIPVLAYMSSLADLIIILTMATITVCTKASGSIAPASTVTGNHMFTNNYRQDFRKSTKPKARIKIKTKAEVGAKENTRTTKTTAQGGIEQEIKSGLAISAIAFFPFQVY